MENNISIPPELNLGLISQRDVLNALTTYVNKPHQGINPNKIDPLWAELALSYTLSSIYNHRFGTTQIPIDQYLLHLPTTTTIHPQLRMHASKIEQLTRMYIMRRSLALEFAKQCHYHHNTLAESPAFQQLVNNWSKSFTQMKRLGLLPNSNTFNDILADLPFAIPAPSPQKSTTIEKKKQPVNAWTNRLNVSPTNEVQNHHVLAQRIPKPVWMVPAAAMLAIAIIGFSGWSSSHTNSNNVVSQLMPAEMTTTGEENNSINSEILPLTEPSIEIPATKEPEVHSQHAAKQTTNNKETSSVQPQEPIAATVFVNSPSGLNLCKLAGKSRRNCPKQSRGKIYHLEPTLILEENDSGWLKILDSQQKEWWAFSYYIIPQTNKAHLQWKPITTTKTNVSVYSDSKLNAKHKRQHLENNIPLVAKQVSKDSYMVMEPGGLRGFVHKEDIRVRNIKVSLPNETTALNME